MKHTHSDSEEKIDEIKRKRRLLRRKRLRQFEVNLLLFFLFLGTFSYLTNPFTKFSVVRDPLSVMMESGSMIPQNKGKLYVFETQPWRMVGSVKAVWHILVNHFSGGGKKTKATDVEGIIDEIHRLRFDPKEPFIISGDHFSMLYPRSLGIFYHSTLDPRTARSDIDWDHRQEMYLKTTAYALRTYNSTKNLSTTIVPIGPDIVTLANFFDPPSDTLYSLLFALSSLQSDHELRQSYPYERLDGQTYTLETTIAAEHLLQTYMPMLRSHYERYITSVTDPETGLVKKTIRLSSMKDSVSRESAFYDNVILWKTQDLAQDLGVIPRDPAKLQQLKNTIISTYWLPEEGYFLEENSEKARTEKHYSSDWLIAFSTHFLDVAVPSEREYFIRSMDFIHKEKLNRPFALKYEPQRQKNILHWPVLIGASSYGTKATWSNLGMEYIKLLNVLFQATCDENYLSEAKYQLTNYEHNIVKYRGYPEVYDEQGNIFQTLLYSSILRTGWIVSFEEARALYRYTDTNKTTYCSPNTPSQPTTDNEPYL